MAIPHSLKPQPLNSLLPCPSPLPQFHLHILPHPPLSRFRFRTYSSISSYSGWDELESSEFNREDPVRNFFVSVVVNERKNGFLFLLGFVTVLAVSRVRVSAFGVVSVLVLGFGAGFGAGMVRDGLGRNGKGIRVLSGVYEEVDEKMSELRNGLVGIGELGGLERVRIGNLIKIVDYVKSKIGNMVNDLDNKGIDFGEFFEGERKFGTKTAQKKKSFENVASDFVKYFGGLIQENIAEFNSSPSNKIANKKDITKEINMKKDEISVSGNSMESEFSNTVPLKSSNSSKFVELNEDILESGETKPTFNEMLSFNEEIDDINSSLRFSKKQGYFEKTVLEDQNSKFGKRDLFNESNESSVLEQTLEIRNRSYKFRFAQIGERDSNQTDPSSNLEEFNQNLQNASEILTKAREFMKNDKYNEEKIDSLLYQSATILCTAVALKPNSILALAQLGNNYLLHGELKLKISRELRSLLSNKESLNSKKKMLSKEGIGSVLVEVCEECESLLIEAGRNYKKVLQIDGNDVKALYNWGLALSFRAQLISEIGPEAAIDADKVYLAAIDKFDAILSKNNSFAPQALYRWGMALQNRSNLRPRNDKEKIKLLNQAKSLFEEVLYLEADNKTVLNALSSCIFELEYHDSLL